MYTAATRAQKHLTLLVQGDISTLANMSRIEKSGLRKINSSVFTFNPIPEDFLHFKDWYEEGKRVSTLTKYLVRSKSEMSIANILYLNNIGFKYEEPLYASDGTMFLPDFTIEYRGQTWYWEHLGLMIKPEYEEHWQNKAAWYEKHFPGQLIVTHEGDQQSDEIRDVFGRYFDISL
jgi:hypothetical protein